MIEFATATVDELRSRKEEIAGLDLENDKELNLDEIAEEVRGINSELEKRAQAEANRVEIRNAVANGEGESVNEEFKNNFKEERKMENVNYGIESVEYRNAWLKNLQGKELNEVEARAYTQTGDSATNAIPTIIADKFFEKMKKLAPMMSEITLMRVSGNLQFVAEGTRNAITKHTENASVSASADTTVKVTLGAYEFMKIISISKSAKMMSVDAFEGWLLEMLAGDLARAIDNYILNDATNGLAAMCGTSSTNQIVQTASGGYVYKDIVDLVALLPAAYDPEAKFLMNKKTLYSQVANIVSSTGRPIFVNPQEGPGMILGYPVITDDYIPTTNNAIYLGKFTDIVGNLSEGPNVEVSEVAGFSTGSILYRGYESFDSKLAKTDAIVRLVSTTA